MEEFQRVSYQLDFLEGLACLDGALSFEDTRHLLVHFLDDYACTERCDLLPKEFSLEDVRAFIEREYGGSEAKSPQRPREISTRTRLLDSLTEQNKKDETSIRSLFGIPSSLSSSDRPLPASSDLFIADYEAAVSRSIARDAYLSKGQSIRLWLRHVVFPKFLEVPFLQRRVAQLVAVAAARKGWKYRI